MKRELKDQTKHLLCYLFHAAAQIPMKRELKGEYFFYLPFCLFRCSPNPYEEGTERVIAFMGIGKNEL